MRRMPGSGLFCLDEVATVSKRHDEQKSRVKQQRHRHEKDFLFGRKRWAAGRSGKIWQNQTEHSQGHDYVEVSIDTLDVVILFPISQPAKQQRYAHKAVEPDHDHCKDCIASERRRSEEHTSEL